MRKFRPKQCPKCKHSPTKYLCYPPRRSIYREPILLDHNHPTKRKCPDFKERPTRAQSDPEYKHTHGRGFGPDIVELTEHTIVLIED